MLYRKISDEIEKYIRGEQILLVDGARQVGKTFIIRQIGKRLFKNYIELNMVEDSISTRTYADVNTLEDFYLQISMMHGDRLHDRSDTLIFIDEIQAYPQLLTLLKFLQQDGRYTYIASGSMLGVALSQTTSIPMGSIRKLRMYPLDFEEFLYANGVGVDALHAIREKYLVRLSLDEVTHERMMDLFRKYLLVGGLPEAVATYVESKNIQVVRQIHSDIYEYYRIDASKYDAANRLKIRRIYDMIPSNMGSKKKRVIIQDIENIKGKTYKHYSNEFDYLISAGIAQAVQAVSTPTFPLVESSGKNLIKLYLNDVGLLSNILYRNNIRAILDDMRSINLGSVYETVVAQELAAHGHRLFYYDNRSRGEVDYLVDDYDNLCSLPIEIKSGRDYTTHSAISAFVGNKDYNVKLGYVFANSREVVQKDGIIYMPIYYIMFV